MNTRFLEAMKAAVRGQQVSWAAGEMTASQWDSLFAMASAHHVLPLVFEAVYSCPAAASCPDLALMKQQAIATVMLQTVKTDGFLTLYKYLRSRGLHPMLIKGLVCRDLYPQPDHRLSSDEDLLVDSREFSACQQALADYGMLSGGGDAYEVPYTKAGTPLYIELHRSLFPPENEAYGDLNRYFSDIHSRAVPITIQGTQLLTMPATDHLFYLILHAFKHFLHSGFGIRQVCDICLFAESYGGHVDWERLLDNCRAVRAHLFASAIFRIGRKHLGFTSAGMHLPAVWKALKVDENLLLEDLLDAGVYGSSSKNRQHSSSMTLNAVAAGKKGRSARLLRTVFPQARDLQGRFPYLKEKPWLLPMAWAQRLGKYTRESRGGEAAASVALGKKRIGLLTQYGILQDTSARRKGKR